jgi:hypothetical protein
MASAAMISSTAIVHSHGERRWAFLRSGIDPILEIRVADCDIPAEGALRERKFPHRRNI